MPSLSVYNIRIYSKVEDYETENKTCVNTKYEWEKMVAASTSASSISLLNPAVDENWLCWHSLLQLILGKQCHVWCSELFKLFANGKFTKRFHFLGARIDLLFIIFICSLYSLWATVGLLHHFGFVCVLILGYAVRIFHAIDAKYLMFHIGWHISLKASMTPDSLIVLCWELGNFV